MAPAKKTDKRVTIPVAVAESAKGRAIVQAIMSARTKRDISVTRAAADIISDVRKRGDAALFDYTKKFDKVKLTPASMRVSIDKLSQIGRTAPAEYRRSLRQAAMRIKRYHARQGVVNFRFSTFDAEYRQVVKPLKRVGLYIPGGRTIYPSSVLMCLIPAWLAGVRDIVVVTPPKGDIHPALAFALTGFQNKVTEVYRVGGAQAIAALAYGTETIAPVDKIVGPGNSFVAAAKRLVYGAVDIDSIAGPSEVVIVADRAAPPRLVAQDLLAQAEHGTGDEIALCITENKTVAEKIADAVAKAIEASPVKKTFLKLPPHAISILVTSSRKESLALSDAIAPEHLQLMTASAEKDLQHVNNAAAVFLGNNTPTALGDYFIGTNHVLPTGGTARYASPLGVESFQKRISIAKANAKGLAIAAENVPLLAKMESFVHHAKSVEVRVKK